MSAVFARRTVGRRFALGAGLLLGMGAFGAADANAQTVLKFATAQAPSSAVVTQCLVPLVEDINTKAGSEFRIQIFNAPTLASITNSWDRVADGVADIGFGIHGSSNLPFPKTTVLGLPLLLSAEKLAEGSIALWKLYESGLIADEYKGVKPIALFSTPVQGLSMRDPIKSVDDLKGQKLRAVDRTVSLMATAFGGSPISVPSTENYQAVAQGVVSGSIANIIQLTVFRVAEASKNQVFEIPLGAPAAFIVMNPNSYSKLSEKGRAILSAETGEVMSRKMGECFQKLHYSLMSKVQSDKSQVFIKLDPAEKAKFEKVLQPVIDQWIKETPDGDKIYTAFKKGLGG